MQLCHIVAIGPVAGIKKSGSRSFIYTIIQIWRVMLCCKNPVFLLLCMWKTIWKQFFFVNMGLILIVVIIG